MPPISEWFHFLTTGLFDVEWESLGLGDKELAALQSDIVNDPEGGPVISGTGARKLRFAIGKKGKSGGVRVIYAIFPARREAVLLRVYGKSGKADLSPAEKKAVKAFVDEYAKGLDEQA